MDSGRNLNIVGPQVRHIRKKQQLKMADLAARCTLVGFRIEWHTISKIERGIRTVSDLEMTLLADALRVSIDELAPVKRPQWRKDTRLPHVEDDDE